VTSSNKKIFKDIPTKFLLDRFSSNFDCRQIMNYLFQKWEKKKKLGVTDYISEIKCVENKSDFEKLARINQHGLQGF